MTFDSVFLAIRLSIYKEEWLMSRAWVREQDGASRSPIPHTQIRSRNACPVLVSRMLYAGIKRMQHIASALVAEFARTAYRYFPCARPLTGMESRRKEDAATCTFLPSLFQKVFPFCFYFFISESRNSLRLPVRLFICDSSTMPRSRDGHVGGRSRLKTFVNDRS